MYTNYRYTKIHSYITRDVQCAYIINGNLSRIIGRLGG